MRLCRRKPYQMPVADQITKKLNGVDLPSRKNNYSEDFLSMGTCALGFDNFYLI